MTSRKKPPGKDTISSVETQSEATDWSLDIKHLRAREQLADQMGGEVKLARQKERGKLNAAKSGR